MKADSTIKVSFILSCGVHVAVFTLFSFVIILDLGSAMSPVEVTYIGSADGRVSASNAAFRKIEIETSPLINLPDRKFATESVVSDTDEEMLLTPTVAGKIDIGRIYARSKPDNEVLGAAGQTVRTVSLDAKQKYTVAGKLSSRKIIIQPPGPEYPDWAIKSGSEAEIKLRVTVNPKGIVESIEKVQSTGHPKMDLEASQYIKQWRFESRVSDTESETGIVSVKFKLK